jgi:hypothetical protein
MIGIHLMPSRVKVSRPLVSMQDGILTTAWRDVAGLEEVPIRLEVGFFRPGKDFPMPPQAGRTPDRVATYWVSPDIDLRPGDHIECVSGPVTGTWQIRVAPDVSTSMSRLHHLEGQAVELPPSVAAGVRSS